MSGRTARGACLLRSRHAPRAVAAALFPIAQRLDDFEHFFVGDEAAAVGQLEVIDRLGEFAGGRRQLLVAVGELASLAGGAAETSWLRRSMKGTAINSGEVLIGWLLDIAGKAWRQPVKV